MGMNIYTLDGAHIGKRWAAGFWCWDCKIPVKNKSCPICGADHKPEFISSYRELGFDKNAPKVRSGINGASGFIWQTGTTGIDDTPYNIINKLISMMNQNISLITEYNEKLNIKDFFAMFKEIIIQESQVHEFT